MHGNHNGSNELSSSSNDILLYSFDLIYNSCSAHLMNVVDIVERTYVPSFSISLSSSYITFWYIYLVFSILTALFLFRLVAFIIFIIRSTEPLLLPRSDRWLFPSSSSSSSSPPSSSFLFLSHPFPFFFSRDTQSLLEFLKARLRMACLTDRLYAAIFSALSIVLLLPLLLLLHLSLLALLLFLILSWFLFLMCSLLLL